MNLAVFYVNFKRRLFNKNVIKNVVTYDVNDVFVGAVFRQDGIKLIETSGRTLKSCGIVERGSTLLQRLSEQKSKSEEIDKSWLYSRIERNENENNKICICFRSKV